MCMHVVCLRPYRAQKADFNRDIMILRQLMETTQQSIWRPQELINAPWILLGLLLLLLLLLLRPGLLLRLLLLLLLPRPMNVCVCADVYDGVFSCVCVHVCMCALRACMCYTNTCMCYTNTFMANI
jgi:hypothetical protein